MTKLNKKQIEEIRELKNQGKSYKELSEIYHVSKSTIIYYTNEMIRMQMIEKAKNVFKNLSKEDRTKSYQKRKEYFRNYLKNRYQNDPEFRKRFIQYIKKYNSRKRMEKNANKKVL